MLQTEGKITFEALYPLISESIERGESFRFTAFGKSMYPYIRGGKDRVSLSPLKKDIAKYDIIFYRRKNGMFVLHRVIGTNNGTFTLCGDNQYAIENGIESDQVIAILTEIERNGKKIRLNSLSGHIWCRLLFLRRFCLHVKSYISRKLKEIHFM